MPAYAFDATQHEPQYGGGGGLPPGKYKGCIVDSRLENNSKGTGGYLALDLTPVEGPLKGTVQTDRLNLLHPNAMTVAIANKQLAAYCAVTGVHQFQQTEELHNKVFLFEIGWQKGQEPTDAKPQGGFTEVKALADMNGNPPGKAGSGPAASPQQAPPPAEPPADAKPNVSVGGWGTKPAEAAPAPEAAKPAGGGWGTQAPATGWGQK